MSRRQETTISFHMGTTVRAMHNRRDPSVVKYERHIREGGPHITYRDDEMEHAFNEVVFREAIDAYNAAQKRKDRRIENYLESVMNDKRGRRDRQTGEVGKKPVRELIVSVGSLVRELQPDGTYKMDADGNWVMPYKLPMDVEREILEAYVASWDKRNDHLHLFGAYWHGDERGASHVHLDFIAWADGYTRGPAKQCSMSKALEQMGCKGEGSLSRNPLVIWQERETAYMQQLTREICAQHGIEITAFAHPYKGKRAKHRETDDYIAEQERRRVESMKKQIEEQRQRELEHQAELERQRQRLIELTDTLDAKDGKMVDKNKRMAAMQHALEVLAMGRGMTVDALIAEAATKPVTYTPDLAARRPAEATQAVREVKARAEAETEKKRAAMAHHQRQQSEAESMEARHRERLRQRLDEYRMSRREDIMRQYAENQAALSNNTNQKQKTDTFDFGF